MFHDLDKDGSGKVSIKELKDLAHKGVLKVGDVEQFVQKAD